VNEEYVRIGFGFIADLLFFFSGVFLLTIIYDLRKGRPVTARLLGIATLLMVLPWLIPAKLVMTLALVLLVSCALVDHWLRQDQTVKERRRGAFMFAAGAAMYVALQVWPGASEGSKYTINDQSIVRQHGEHRVTLQRSAIRIIEFVDRSSRYWHIKDGSDNISVAGDEYFAGPGGSTLDAAALVARLERWAGVKREIESAAPDAL
jgi:hypothetical protein